MNKSSETEKRGIRRYVIDRLLNFSIVFVSYILASLIRYQLFRPDHVIDPFSLSFLIIALVYSLLMAFSFEYEEPPRTLQRTEIFDGFYQIISKNAIGCLMLASVFFVTGIMNFSRWALFLFWIFSSIGLIIKRIAIYSRTARRRCEGLDVWNVVILGDGKPAEDYIKSVTDNPQFGIKIKGYFGASDHLRVNLDGWFEPEKFPFPRIEWLGEYDKEKMRALVDVDEVIIAEQEDFSAEQAAAIYELISTGKKVSFSVPYSSCITHGSYTRDLGAAKLIIAKESIKKNNYARAGIIISIALLLIILMVRNSDVSSMDPVYMRAGIEKIRSVLFAALGFFIFWTASDKLAGTKHGLIKSAVISLVCSTSLILLYELIYPGVYWTSVLIDFVPTVIVIGVFFGMKETIKIFAKSMVGE